MLAAAYCVGYFCAARWLIDLSSKNVRASIHYPVYAVKNLRDAFLRPLQIPLYLLGGLHAVRKVSLHGCEPRPRARLQLEEFAVFGVQLTRSKNSISLVLRHLAVQLANVQ